MSKFKYMELAVTAPHNRGQYKATKEVINIPFQKENRFKEYWRSMYVYDTNTPNENSPLFGNFYIECDEEDFNVNKNTMLEVCTYLHKKLDIPYEYFDFFMTNRSIWLTIPTKVFGCFGSAKLHLIHKSMAEEIQYHLSSKGYDKGIDLSIYKWNGLMHSLGSYLHNSKRWVTKFNFSDLEQSARREDLLHAKYDNFYTFEDMSLLQKAQVWFQKHKQNVFNYKKENKKQNKSIRKEYLCMKKLEEKGYIEDNRNLHIYTYALYLKDRGLSLEDGTNKIQKTFSNTYVYTKECLRTIRSAFNGNKHFSYRAAKQYLSPDLFEEEEERNTFIVPRLFISKLNDNKAHYLAYKFLIEILYDQQINRKEYVFSLKGLTHKKDLLNNFDLLQDLNIIEYTIEENNVVANLIYKEREIYKSHIVLPKHFITTSLYKNMKKEIKVFLELLRSSFKTKKGYYFSNIKLETLMKNIRSTKKTTKKYLAFLRKSKALIGQFVLPTPDKASVKQLIKKMVRKYKQHKNMLYLNYNINVLQKQVCNQINLVKSETRKYVSMLEYLLLFLYSVSDYCISSKS